MRIALAAEESAGVHTLRLLAGSVHHVCAVVTASSRGDRARGLTVAAVADELGIDIVPGAAVRDPCLADLLRGEGVDVLLNVHSLHVVHPAVLAAPRFGCFNLHPGPLPRYAGLNAPNWALYHGETTHGVTLHWMAPGIDTGPIAYQATFPIEARDSGFSVSATCVREGLRLVSRLLDDLAIDTRRVPAIEQDVALRRYFGRGIPHDGWIRWAEDAVHVTGLVRACDYGPWTSPWGRPRTRGNKGLEITVRRARHTGRPAADPPGTVGRCDSEEAWVATGDEWVVISRLHVEGTATPASLVLAPGDVLCTPAATCDEAQFPPRSSHNVS
jgi:UDP-4-amino-4-deoxy-L-arabinose formyltransferase/UDP-glucuronic acid dehydrogenase (UDP-4-keto-hexauronic acid decarboxylating)